MGGAFAVKYTGAMVLQVRCFFLLMMIVPFLSLAEAIWQHYKIKQEQ